MKSISVPFQFFTEADGTPLDNGNIYIGTENLNPETYPIQVWADPAGTIPLSQPIKTSDGYMVRYGTPVNIFVDSAYSITVKNKNGELVYTLPSSAVITESSGSGNVVDDFGAVPDNPAIDNTDSFNEAFSSSNGQIFIPAGTYNIDSLLIIDCDNLEVYGVEGATILSSSNLVELAQIVRMENVNFYGVTFELTTASGLPSRGVVFADDPLITNSSFVRCTQTAPNCKAGGFMVDGTGVINTFDLTDNIVFDVGGKGIYFSATEYKNVTVTGGIVKNTALYTLENGDGVTFAGGGSQSTINGIAISNTFGACIKLDSVSDIFVTNNRFSDLSRICDVIDSDETSARNVSITYFNNETVGRVFDGSVNIVAHDNPQLSQNRWYLTGAFHVTDTVKLKASGDTVDSTFANAILIDGESNNNEWLGGLITNADAVDDAGNVTVLTSGADVEVTRIVSVEIYKTASGELSGAETGAEAPRLIYCYGDSFQAGEGVTTTWTPVLYFTGTTTPWNSTYTADGSYVTNGNLVTYDARIIISVVGAGGAGDTFDILGLPYAVTVNTRYMSGAVRFANISSVAGGLISITFQSPAFMGDMACGVADNGGTSTSLITRADLNAGCELRISGMYFADII